LIFFLLARKDIPKVLA